MFLSFVMEPQKDIVSLGISLHFRTQKAPLTSCIGWKIENYSNVTYFSGEKELLDAFTVPIYRRVAEFHMRLTFWENLPHHHKGWNRSQIKTKCLYFNFDWVVRSKIGSVISKKGEITLSVQKRELWSTNFESLFAVLKHYFFANYFIF